MPELPEVEIARENLERWLSGRIIGEVRVLDRRVLRGQKPSELARALSGARVHRVSRRGKYLIWDLGPRGEVLAHLGMSGKFLLRESGAADPPAGCVALGLGRGRRIVFSDVRRFGRFQLLRGREKGRLQSLGVEPLAAEFTPARLAGLLRGVRQPIKPFLLDQRRIAGLGNIHAAEALFRAGIHPARPAGRINGRQARRLHQAIRVSLLQALELERGPEPVYLEESGAANPFLVYGRLGERCARCSARVRRLVQAGRSSFYCPRCQSPRRPRRPPAGKRRGGR